MGNEIDKAPLSQVITYNTLFYVLSSLDEILGRAFVGRDTGILEEKLVPPQGAKLRWYDGPLKRYNPSMQSEFGFKPTTYIQIDGHSGSEQNKDVAELARQTIEKFADLSRNHGASTVFFDGITYYIPGTKQQPIPQDSSSSP